MQEVYNVNAPFIKKNKTKKIFVKLVDCGDDVEKGFNFKASTTRQNMGSMAHTLRWNGMCVVKQRESM